MGRKKSPFQRPESAKNKFVLVILLALGIPIPFASAGEATLESQEALQSSMLRNQVLFDQQMSVLQTGRVQENVSRVETMLEHETDQNLREIRLAVEEPQIQQEIYAEEIELYLLPGELGGDSKVCFAKNEAGEC